MNEGDWPGVAPGDVAGVRRLVPGGGASRSACAAFWSQLPEAFHESGWLSRASS